jgi:hypothetical protein
MRFTEQGPNLPNELLDARDAGDMVFLCGAGISIPAGLPDFFRLTADVAERLGVQATSQSGRLIETERQYRAAGAGAGHHEPIAFDRIFTLLVREFGVAQVASASSPPTSTRSSTGRSHACAVMRRRNSRICRGATALMAWCICMACCRRARGARSARACPQQRRLRPAECPAG